jgi:uncharacterized phiE125 gp8 family phage protein
MVNPRNPTRKRITAPAEFVTMAEARGQVRVTHSLEDAEIARYLATAIEYCEAVTGLYTTSGSVRLTCNGFPSQSHKDEPNGGGDEPLSLMCAPVSSIESVQYRETPGGSLLTLDAARWRLESTSEPAILVPVDAWPTMQATPGGVVITMTAGHTSAAAVPATMKSAVLALLAHMYENREVAVMGANIQTVPKHFDALMATLKVGNHW